MARHWQFNSHDSGLVESLARQMRCSTLVAQVLLSRNISDAEQAKAFLVAKLSDVREPETLPGVSQAAEIIVRAIRENRRITIYGDYDVDGMTSTAILQQCLQLAGAQVDYYIPCRLEEGYGLNCDALRELHKTDPERLVVTVDCGISSVTEAALARQIGLDLIITDHHTISEQLPDALALVHPELPGGTAAEPGAFTPLCGAGVAFKLAWAVCKVLGGGKRATEKMRTFLKKAVCLSMIGTIADVVPLVSENRLIVKYGLSTLKEQAGPGLLALMKIAGIDEKSSLNSEDIAFALSPRLNAAGRLGQARLAVELLTTTDESRATQLAVYLDGLNRQRQSVERKILKQAKEAVQNNEHWLDQNTLVISHHDWHAGVIGIVASRVAEHFEKPTILVTFDTNNGIGQGSGRSYGNFNLHRTTSKCEEYLETFGGHAAAIGLKVKQEKIDAFRDALSEAAQETPAELEQQPRLIDAEVSLSELSVQSVRELDYLGPFGNANERPLFVSTSVTLAEPPRTMGEGGRHLSLKVKQFGQTMRAVAFGRGEWAEEIEKEQGPIAICFKPMINEFRGRTSVEMQLIDWKAEHELAPTGSA